MANLTNHPDAFLNDAAATDFNKAEADHGVLTLNAAGRTEALQQELINRWNAGGAANRPPYLYQPATPASASNHVVNGGQAVDIANYTKFMPYCQSYGFIHSFPTSDPVHFDHFGTDPATGHVNPNQVTLDRQNWILIHPGISVGPSGADGVDGPDTKAGYTAYEHFLHDNDFGYNGAFDGIWGPQLQAAHQRYADSLVTPPAPTPPAPPAVAGHTATVTDLGELSDVRGLQKIAKLNGGNTDIDNQWGRNSRTGLTNFLNVNYHGSLATWLRTKWGYKDADDNWGSNMKAAAERANAANFIALKV